jgi:uncharacterized protein YjbI with pentapeptide repeats
MTRNDTIASLAVNSWINRDHVIWPNADLTGANLIRANLTGANLRWSKLTGAKITLGNLTFPLTEETAL